MAGLKRNHCSMILICSLQPILQMCFRTESEDGSSGETNFFPELSLQEQQNAQAHSEVVGWFLPIKKSK
jgi:hypothetical protein